MLVLSTGKDIPIHMYCSFATNAKHRKYSIIKSRNKHRFEKFGRFRVMMETMITHSAVHVYKESAWLRE
jgi:hypothetical protein